MNWIDLSSLEQLEEIVRLSDKRTLVIFKHSTRCSISSLAYNRLKAADLPADADFYYLDLIRYREISNAVAERFSVQHESPQVLVIRNGNCVYNESHTGIFPELVFEQV